MPGDLPPVGARVRVRPVSWIYGPGFADPFDGTVTTRESSRNVVYVVADDLANDWCGWVSADEIEEVPTDE